MEARRTLQGEARSFKQIWLVVAALLAVLVLGMAGGYLAKGLTSSSAPAREHVVPVILQAPAPQDSEKQTVSHSQPTAI